jgi:uncharacterized protein (TIGR00730 family)
MDYLNINEQLIKAKRVMEVEGVEGTLAFFGSARTKRSAKEYKKALKISKAVAETFPEYFICSGGGHGLMEAFNKGAHQAKARSIGMGIELPFETEMNKYVDIPIMFEHFFIRKYWLLYNAMAVLAFEGGVGTLDEIIETIVLIQTKKVEPMPIVLVGAEYWNRVIDWKYLADEGYISKSDFDLFIISDDINTIVQYLKENINHEHTFNG